MRKRMPHHPRRQPLEDSLAVHAASPFHLVVVVVAEAEQGAEKGYEAAEHGDGDVAPLPSELLREQREERDERGCRDEAEPFQHVVHAVRQVRADGLRQVTVLPSLLRRVAWDWRRGRCSCGSF